MPRQIRAIPDSMLQSNGVHDLDPGTPLVAAQAGLLLGRSKTRMDSDRRDGKPPPFYRDGTKVLYRLGDVLAARSGMQDAAIVTHGKPPKDYDRFLTYLTKGGIHDTWPMALVAGRPLDFFASLQVGPSIDDAEWMTLDEILNALRIAAEAEAAEEEGEDLMQLVDIESLPAAKPGDVL